MTGWTPDELATIAAAHSLHLTVGPHPHPGVELGMAVVHGRLYVRAYGGTRSRWYRAAADTGACTVTAAGLGRAAVATPSTQDSDGIDAVYLAKYGESGAMVTTPAARAATLHIAPA